MKKEIKELQPAIHRKWIKQGKMTEEESERIVNDWKFQQAVKKQMKVIEDAFQAEYEEEMERKEAEYQAELAERSDRQSYEEAIDFRDEK